MTPEEAHVLADMKVWIMFDALFEKGLLNYADVQDAIGRFRDMISPEHPMYPMLKQAADRMERVYQPGTYDQPA